MSARDSSPNSQSPATAQMGELEFRRFQKLIFEAAGIRLTAAKQPMVAGRLAKRLKKLNLPDFVSYVRYVDQNPAEHQLVVDLLTTNETYFFREPKHFDFLRAQLLPAHPRCHPLRVWSAACSTGEEPYSLAMLLADQFSGRDWKIMASDISTQVLERARVGHYPIARTEHIPLEYLKRFCLRGVADEEGTLLVDKKLRQQVEFKQVNLMAPMNQLPQFDLILLRNVLIYFDAATKAQVVARVAGQLKPGGHLFIGHSETLNGLQAGLQQAAPAIYRKPG